MIIMISKYSITSPSQLHPIDDTRCKLALSIQCLTDIVKQHSSQKK
jgi:hypothetical protein